MYEDDNKIHISNDSLPTDFSLDDILAEYGAEEPEPPEQDDTAERSKRIVLDALDGNVSEVSFSSIDDIIGDIQGSVDIVDILRPTYNFKASY